MCGQPFRTKLKICNSICLNKKAEEEKWNAIIDPTFALANGWMSQTMKK
jgi:hypothetical protein